jgi:mandelamide amidase
MAQSVADLALLDQILVEDSAINRADLKRIRLGLVPEFMANQDDDTRAVTKAALEKLRNAGVTFVDIEMPQLRKLDDETEFPIVTYEVRDDLQAYLKKYDAGVDLEKLVSLMASPDEEKLYQDTHREWRDRAGCGLSTRDARITAGDAKTLP